MCDIASSEKLVEQSLSTIPGDRCDFCGGNL